MPIQMSKFQQEQVRKREERMKHLVQNISFSANFIECICGTRVQAIHRKGDLVSKDWSLHLREHGQNQS